METKCWMKSHLQNGKEKKLTYNYFWKKNVANSVMKEIINGIKKEEITSA